MITYVVLASFTDQGIRNVRDAMKRADAFEEMAKKFGDYEAHLLDRKGSI